MVKGFRPLVADDVEQWLLAKEPRTAVGRAGQARSCPLAGYFYEHGVQNPIVSGDVYYAVHPAPLPHWATLFVSLVDTYKGSLVPAERALSYLQLARARADFATPDA